MPGVELLAKRTSQAMGSLYADYDVLWAPSRRESLGFGAIEAIVSGLPVVASRCGGLPEVVEDGATGLLVDGEDPEALARMTLRLVDDANLYETLSGRCASVGRETFRFQSFVGSLEQLIEGNAPLSCAPATRS